MLNAEYIDTLCAWMETPVGSSEEAELDVELLALDDQPAQQDASLVDELAYCRAADESG